MSAADNTPAALSPEREAEIREAVAALDADRTLTLGTWTASQVNEKSVLPPDFAHVVEDVLRTESGAVLRGSVGVFGNEEHATFTALARTAVSELLTELDRTRAERDELKRRVAELERPAVEAERGEIQLSYRQLAAQAREDRDYEGEATVLQRLEEREQQWAREDEEAAS